MKKFKVQTRFIFEGVFIITADSECQAEEYVEKHCGLVIGGDIHSTLPDDEVDWDFSVHPEKEIVSVKQIRKQLSNQEEEEIQSQIKELACELAEKTLVDRYNLLPEYLYNSEGNYLEKYQDEFNENYNAYFEQLTKLIFPEDENE